MLADHTSVGRPTGSRVVNNLDRTNQEGWLKIGLRLSGWKVHNFYYHMIPWHQFRQLLFISPLGIQERNSMWHPADTGYSDPDKNPGHCALPPFHSNGNFSIKFPHHTYVHRKEVRASNLPCVRSRSQLSGSHDSCLFESPLGVKVIDTSLKQMI